MIGRDVFWIASEDPIRHSVGWLQGLVRSQIKRRPFEHCFNFVAFDQGDPRVSELKADLAALGLECRYDPRLRTEPDFETYVHGAGCKWSEEEMLEADFVLASQIPVEQSFDFWTDPSGGILSKRDPCDFPESSMARFCSDLHGVGFLVSDNYYQQEREHGLLSRSSVEPLPLTSHLSLIHI